jgi:cytochrome c oxidase cbb3-type subunit 3
VHLAEIRSHVAAVVIHVPRRNPIGFALAAALVAVAGASGALSTSGTTVTVIAGTPAETSLQLTPKTVRAGTVVFRVQNQGKKPHRFEICANGKTGSACAGKMTPVLAPGKAASLTVKLASGRFSYLDALGKAAKGVLVVSTAKAGTTSSPTPTPTPTKTSTGGGTAGGGSSAPGTASPTGPADVAAGRQIFTSVGCTGCHTLAAVGSTGGISLDDLQPTIAIAIDNITNGNSGGMPDFGSQLTKTQISSVATFVFCATHAGAAAC